MASASVTFTMPTEKNIRDYTKEIREYKARNVALEEENRCYKQEMNSVTEYKTCANELHKEFCDMAKKVYPCLQEFQDIVRILSLSDQVKKKNIELT